MAGMLVGWLLRRAGAQSLPDNKAANYGETAATTCTRMAPDFEAEVGAAEIGMVVEKSASHLVKGLLIKRIGNSKTLVNNSDLIYKAS